MDKKIIFLYIFLLFPQSSHAHKTYSPDPAPYRDLSNGEKISYLGYGSYGLSSDAEARALMRPRCDHQNQIEYIKCAGGKFLDILSPEKIKNIDYSIKFASFQDTERELIKNVKKKIFERSLIELAVNGATSPGSIELPACLKTDVDSQALQLLAEDIGSSPSTMDASRFLKNPTLENLEQLNPGSIDFKFANRYQGIASSTDFASGIEALILGEQLKVRHQRQITRFKTKGRLWWKKTVHYPDYQNLFETKNCKDQDCKIDQARLRELKNHHPEIFQGKSSKHANSIKKHLSKILDIKKFGGKFKRNNSNAKINSPLQAMIRNDYLSRNPIPEIQDYLLEAKQLAEKLPKKPTKAQKKMAKAYKKIIRDLKKMRKERNKDLKNNIKDLCNLDKKIPLDQQVINFLKDNYPLELNQAVIDMKDKSKEAAYKLLICARAKGFNDPKEEIRDGRCDDVEKISDDEIKMSSRKVTYQNTNKGSQLGYTIKKGKPPLITSKVKFMKTPGISMDEYKKFIKTQTDDINNFLNCQSGFLKSYKDKQGNEIKCPVLNPPKAKFKISIVDDSAAETDVEFKVHKCYRGTSTAQNCNGAVKEAAIKECQSRYKSKQQGVSLNDLFPDRQKIRTPNRKTKTSYYLNYALDCVERAKHLSKCEGLNGCDLQTCTALACAIPPPQAGACLKKEVIDMICNRQLRTPEELENDPVPVDQLPEIPPKDSPRWNRPNSSNLALGYGNHLFRHEMSHRLGVDDEYFDNNSFPIPNNGEKDSLMRKGDRLKPRHFDEMLKPLHCLDRKYPYSNY